MANLSKVSNPIKELKQVATQIKNVALFFAPKKTGNLKRALNAENRPDSMFKIANIGAGTRFTFSLNIAPSGAEYGKFWNSPNVSSTVRKGKTPNVPRSIDYGIQALNDKSVKTEIDRLIAGYSDALVSEKIRVLVGGKLEKGFQQLSSIK